MWNQCGINVESMWNQCENNQHIQTWNIFKFHMRDKVYISDWYVLFQVSQKTECIAGYVADLSILHTECGR